MASKIEVSLTPKALNAYKALCKLPNTPKHPRLVATAIFEAGLERLTLEADVVALETPSTEAAPRRRRGRPRRSDSSEVQAPGLLDS